MREFDEEKREVSSETAETSNQSVSDVATPVATSSITGQVDQTETIDQEEFISPKDAAEEAIADSNLGQIVLYGEASEAAAVAQSGVSKDTGNFNEASKNYPTFDVTCSEYIASVKTHQVVETENEITGEMEGDYSAYVKDFEHMQGENRAFEDRKSPVQQDADRLIDLRDSENNLELPDEIDGMNQEEVSDYLYHNGVLMVPDDHLGNVREALYHEVENCPDRYGLAMDATTQEMMDMVNTRVKGIGVTYTELQEMVDERRALQKSETD